MSAATPLHAQDVNSTVSSTGLADDDGDDALKYRLETAKDAKTPTILAFKKRLELWHDVFVQHLHIYVQHSFRRKIFR